MAGIRGQESGGLATGDQSVDPAEQRRASSGIMPHNLGSWHNAGAVGHASLRKHVMHKASFAYQLTGRILPQRKNNLDRRARVGQYALGR